jgi:hypothetical protein
MMPEVEPTRDLLMPVSEAEAIQLGRARYSDEHKHPQQVVAVILILSIVYMFATLLLGRWFVLGLLVPLAAVWVIGIRQGARAKDAGAEELERVRNLPENKD